MTPEQFCARIGIAHPIIQAPMGGFTPPELVAAVSNAGGLGSLGAPYFTPQQITDAAARIRELTRASFGINVFAGGYATENTIDPAPMLALLAEIHAELDLPPPSLPPLGKSPLKGKIDAVVAAKPAVFSFAFGIPERADIARVQASGSFVIGTATNVAEAKALNEAGVNAIAAQGGEAGAHRGTFIGRFEDSMMPVRELVSAIVQVTDLPVIAAGGLMTGADVADLIKRGAVAGQLGTAYLPCPESSAAPTHKDALMAARSDETRVTRAYSGRHARGIVTEIMRRLDPRPEIILPFPLQNDLTRPLRNAATKAGDARWLSLWAGQGVSRSRQMPAGKLTTVLIAELLAAR